MVDDSFSKALPSLYKKTSRHNVVCNSFYLFFFSHKYISPTFKRHQIINTKILFCIGMDSDVFKLLAVFDFFSDILKSGITLMGRGQKSCVPQKWEPACTNHKIEHR